ncbi:MAG: deoxyribodipyrimidine photo-lyase [Candidatus Woesearchaeota archaeon]
MIHSERIKKLNGNKIQDSDKIFYWLQSSQRANYNHALEYAIKKANNLDKKLFVFFVIVDDFPEANLRHYQFMLEGLVDLKEKLNKRNIEFKIFSGNIVKIVSKIAKDSALMITDRDYLKTTKTWRKEIAKKISSPLIQVESNLIVPVEEASNKEEYAAYTIRKKINKKLDYYLKDLQIKKLNNSTLNKELNLSDKLKNKEVSKYFNDTNSMKKLLKSLDISKEVKGVNEFKGGESEAKKHLYDFLATKLDQYHNLSSDPTKDYISHLSPYLHFGQISPLLIALEAKEKYSAALDDFLEQLIIRRELSFNFVYYNKNYDGKLKNILPDWAYTTLEEHKNDKREFLYSKKEFENAKTHDKYWNKAQKNLVKKGFIHGYMRMYWGKKILEWTETPQKAYEIALYLNNKYALDGRDPNSYAGIAWCFGKHDRAWKERKVYGKTRYMNANGLERKFTMENY